MSSMISSATRSRVPMRLDAVGAVASFVCALHCALLAVVAAALPYAGFEQFQSHAFDRGFAMFATLFGLVVIGTGACRQRLSSVLPLFATGVALLFTGAFAAIESAWHPVLLALGGIAVASAHAVNRHAITHHGCEPVNLWGLFLRVSLRARAKTAIPGGLPREANS